MIYKKIRAKGIGHRAWSMGKKAKSKGHRAKREVNEMQDCKSICLPLLYAPCHLSKTLCPLPKLKLEILDW